MNFYRRFILPRLIDLAMGNRLVAKYRGMMVPAARGRVLEIGIGSGLNLPFYGADVTQLFGLDPSPGLLRMADHRTDAAPFPIELVRGEAEDIPLESGSVDTLVSTWSLCSIAGIDQALSEMRRVLKPDGRLIFVEHGLAPEATVRRWQHRLNPLWGRIGGGCHLNRQVDKLIEQAGFQLDALTCEYAQGPKFLTYFYRGIARLR